MLFNSIEFIIFFVVVLSLLSLIKFKKFQHSLLLLASYFFFYFTSNYLILLLIFSTILDFYIGKYIWNAKSIKQKKILLIISLAGNLGLLGFYKYADFAILQFNFLNEQFNLASSIPFLNIVLPIGISFYTFQTISYTVDIYRGHLKPSKSFSEFALFVAFFPQLVAGPIVRAKDFLPQLREKIENYQQTQKLISIKSRNLKLGVTIMAFGFFKKIFFADNIAPLVNDIFSNPVGLESFTIILGTLAFGIQIYADFSGYSSIAIGAALILGFKLPINFNKPYFATSPSDFWNRWHISLSSWLRDYLYIPLGGSRKSNNRTYLNLFTVMFLGGLWHGASWNFVIWGFLHGSFLAIHRLLINHIPFLKHPFFTSKFGKIISIFITQYFVFLAWISFRVQDFDHLTYSIYKFVILDFQTTETINFVLSNHKTSVIFMIAFIAIHLYSYKQKTLEEKISNLKLRYWCLFLFAIILLILFFLNGRPEDFIYFQF